MIKLTIKTAKWCHRPPLCVLITRMCSLETLVPLGVCDWLRSLLVVSKCPTLNFLLSLFSYLILKSFFSGEWTLRFLMVFGVYFFIFLFIFLFFYSLFLFWGKVSLCSPGCPGTCSIDQAGLELRNPPACAGIKGVQHCHLAVVVVCLFPFLGHRMKTFLLKAKHDGGGLKSQ